MTQAPTLAPQQGQLTNSTNAPTLSPSTVVDEDDDKCVIDEYIAFRNGTAWWTCVLVGFGLSAPALIFVLRGGGRRPRFFSSIVGLFGKTFFASMTFATLLISCNDTGIESIPTSEIAAIGTFFLGVLINLVIDFFAFLFGKLERETSGFESSRWSLLGFSTRDRLVACLFGPIILVPGLLIVIGYYVALDDNTTAKYVLVPFAGIVWLVLTVSAFCCQCDAGLAISGTQWRWFICETILLDLIGTIVSAYVDGAQSLITFLVGDVVDILNFVLSYCGRDAEECPLNCFQE